MRQVAISHYIKAWDTGQVLNELDPVRLHGSSQQVRRGSNMLLAPCGAGRYSSNPHFHISRVCAQVVLFCGALQPRKLCHAQERVPRRLSLAQSRLDVGLRDLPST